MLVTTTIQIDENDRTPDKAKRLGIQQIPVTGTPAPFVIDVSRLDASVLASDDEAAVYEQLIIGNSKHAEDAAILIAARREGIPLVTKEARLLKQCKCHGVVGMTPADLLALIP